MCWTVTASSRWSMVSKSTVHACVRSTQDTMKGVSSMLEVEMCSPPRSQNQSGVWRQTMMGGIIDVLCGRRICVRVKLHGQFTLPLERDAMQLVLRPALHREISIKHNHRNTQASTASTAYNNLPCTIAPNSANTQAHSRPLFAA